MEYDHSYLDQSIKDQCIVCKNTKTSEYFCDEHKDCKYKEIIKDITNQIRIFLKKVSDASTKEEKKQEVKHIFSLLTNNKWFLYYNLIFSKTVFNKLHEDQFISDKFNIFISQLFPNYILIKSYEEIMDNDIYRPIDFESFTTRIEYRFNKKQSKDIIIKYCQNCKINNIHECDKYIEKYGIELIMILYPQIKDILLIKRNY